MVRVTRSKLARDNQPIIATNDSEEADNEANLTIKVESGNRQTRLQPFEVEAVGITEAIEGRPIAKLFNTLPDRKRYPDYYEEETNFFGYHKDDHELEADLELMFKNAKKYNVEGSQIYNDAVELQMLSLELFGGDPNDATNADRQTQVYHEEIEHKGEMYRIGEYVHIYNERNPKKPNVGLIFNIWKNERICWYYHPEQTKHQASKKFYSCEVFKTNTFQDHSINDVLEKCFVLPIREYIVGKPKNSEGKMVYLCESRYTEHGNTFSKIRNWLGCMPKDSKLVKTELEKYDSPLILRKVGSPLAAAMQSSNSNKMEEDIQQMTTSSDFEFELVDSVNSSGSESTFISQSKNNTTIPNSLSSNISNHRLISSRTRNVKQRQQSVTSPNNQVDLNPLMVPRMATINPMMYGDSGMLPNYGYPYQTHYQHPQHIIMSPQYTQHYPMMTTSQVPQVQHHMSIQTNDSSSGSTISQNISKVPTSKCSIAELPSETVLWFTTPPIDVTPLPQPMHSIEYLHRKEEIHERKRQRLQEEMSNNETRPENVPIIPESNSLQESDLSYTIQEIANKWNEDAISLSMQLWNGEGSWDK
ncbi:8037_t:CDS:10 [Diversispora eburnea]|uniref:8037_t:CDS:1 n=1 Tax=Diversispora eburnea TaxID=1213867 RepID=A0A9N8VMM1_9GLOM|nr:8037_t:CDS:10 [Diversispora eburnea]